MVSPWIILYHRCFIQTVHYIKVVSQEIRCDSWVVFVNRCCFRLWGPRNRSGVGTRLGLFYPLCSKVVMITARSSLEMLKALFLTVINDFGDDTAPFSVLTIFSTLGYVQQKRWYTCSFLTGTVFSKNDSYSRNHWYPPICSPTVSAAHSYMSSLTRRTLCFEPVCWQLHFCGDLRGYHVSTVAQTGITCEQAVHPFGTIVAIFKSSRRLSKQISLAFIFFFSVVSILMKWNWLYAPRKTGHARKSSVRPWICAAPHVTAHCVTSKQTSTWRHSFDTRIVDFSCSVL